MEDISRGKVVRRQNFDFRLHCIVCDAYETTTGQEARKLFRAKHSHSGYYKRLYGRYADIHRVKNERRKKSNWTRIDDISNKVMVES